MIFAYALHVYPCFIHKSRIFVFGSLGADITLIENACGCPTAASHPDVPVN